MLKIAPITVQQHHLLAVPLYDREVGGPGITVLVVLVAVAFALVKALRAAAAAVVLLIRPTLVLLRTLIFVVGLIVVIGWGLISGPDREETGSGRPAPTSTRPAPEPAGEFARR